MARRKQQSPPVPEPKVFHSVGEIDQAVSKLTLRIRDVEVLKTSGARYDAPDVRPTAQKIRSTILEVYGATSPEFLANQHHTIWHGGHTINMHPDEAQEHFALGIDDTLAMLNGLVSDLEEKKQFLGPTVSPEREAGPQGSRVFIGHGRSAVWKDLKEFLVDRLKLEYEEFNRESAAGFANKERLNQMLDGSCFAFLVMTAEDEHPDGTLHPRENVIHETGLFQGRHGFERAIVLAEDGCAEFSNIHGLVQIRFPKGNIQAASEEIRRVLEREGVIPKA